MFNSAFKNFYNIESRKHGLLYVFLFIYYFITMIAPSIILAFNGIDHGYFAMNHYYLISIIFLATINSYVIFKYLNNKSEIDFLHSLPARRESILYSKLLFGFNVYLFTTIFSFLICYLSLLYIRPNAIIVQLAIVKMFLCNFLFYILCFLIVSFAMCVSGNGIFALFFSFFIHVLGYLLILSYILLNISFNKSESINKIVKLFFDYLSPSNIYISLSESNTILLPIIIILLYIFIMFKLCQYSFINRKLEKYNKIFVFDALARLFQVIASIFIGLIGGGMLLVFYEHDITSITKLIILLVGVLVISTLTFIVIEFLYNKKLSISLNKIIDFILSLLVPIFVVVLYTYVVGG